MSHLAVCCFMLILLLFLLFLTFSGFSSLCGIGFVCFFIHIFLGDCWASWIWKLRIISTSLGKIWHYIFKYLLLLFIFSFWESSCWSTWYWPYVSVVLLCFFQYFPFLLLWLENVQKSFFKFTSSSFCYLKSLVEPVCYHFLSQLLHFSNIEF